MIYKFILSNLFLREYISHSLLTLLVPLMCSEYPIEFRYKNNTTIKKER